MFLIFYHFLMTLFSLLFIPLLPFLKRERMRARLALDLPNKVPAPAPIWVHALSVGEVISAIPLLEAIRQRFPAKKLVFSVTTRQGMALARSQLKNSVDCLFTMPFDFWWSTGRVVKRIRPAAFILIETDIWPGFLGHLKKKGVKSVLVNGRVSPSAQRNYSFLPFLTRRLFEPFQRCLMQTELDRNCLLNLGLDADKIQTTGNIKFDRAWSPMGNAERQRWLDDLKLGPEDILMVAGSTHPGEEETILEAFGRLCGVSNKMRLLIAPRKIDRAGDIKRMAENSGFSSLLRTCMVGNAMPYQVLIIDTLGELARLYGLANFSFVGGSLRPFGGHNLLEPASFGCPVFFGPHTENFVQMAEELTQSGGGMRVHNAMELFSAIKPLMAEPELAHKMGKKAEKFVLRNRGAVGRVLEQIGHLLPDL